MVMVEIIKCPISGLYIFPEMCKDKCYFNKKFCVAEKIKIREKDLKKILILNELIKESILK